MGAGRSIVVEEVERLVAPILDKQKMELVDTQFLHEHGRWVLRLFLDKEGGVTLDDCAQMSDRLGRMLDATSVISQSYSLEVSSPGLNRPLRKEHDFRRFLGQRADITIFAPLDGRRHFRGIIHGVEEGNVVIQDVTEQLFSLPLSGIAKARLDPEITI